MKAIQMQKGGGPEVLELKELPLPQPAAGEVRVRAQAIGISSADMLVRKGVYNWMPPLPAIPGNELAGVVDTLGRDVTGVRVGQRVLVSSRELPFRGGCYAEAICVPAASLFLLPDSIAPNDAVSLPNYQLAGALLYESGVCKPRSVAAYGASGGVGMALLQLALCDGMVAIGIVSTEEKRAFVQRAGVEHVLIRGKDDLRARVMALTGNRGVDAIYAMGGPSAAFVSNLDLLAPLGTLVSFAILGGLMPDADIFGELRKRLGKSLGVRCYSVHALDHERQLRRSLMERAIDLMAAGRLRPPAPTVMPLGEAARAHEMMEAGRTVGKIVLTL
ncbi:MAG TPA: zinc-dependent alcohol dehydrogenase family protein [Burkholderiales bacterium]|nr:zinc-dependent alcohol dehydrogenase family protein [Burkholderiales bacterium]